MMHLEIQCDGTVRLPAKLLRAARLRPGARVAVSAGAGQLFLSAERGALARAYAAYYRAAKSGVSREQLEIEEEFAVADAEVMESPHAPTAPAPRRPIHRPVGPYRRRRNS